MYTPEQQQALAHAYAILRTAGMLRQDRPVDSRYERRLARAKLCRSRLGELAPFEFESMRGRYSCGLLEELVDAVMAFPGWHGDELAALFDRRATWFNALPRDGFNAVGV